MPLTKSRLEKLIAQAEASPNVSERQVEDLRFALARLDGESFARSRARSPHVKEEDGKVIYSTGPIDPWVEKKLKKEVSGLKSFLKRISLQRA